MENRIKVTEETKVENVNENTEISPPNEEFLPPYPKTVLPLRDPKIVLKQIEKATERLKHAKKALKWCRYEYFYSTGDEIYLRHNEFAEMLKFITGKDQIEPMPISKWRKIRRKMGPPKRLSNSFLAAEREKLKIWRTNSLQVRTGEVKRHFCPFSFLFFNFCVKCDPQYSQLLPPLPQSGCILCVCPDENIILHGILQLCANEKFAVSFIPSFEQNEITKHRKNSSIDVWLDEENIMVCFISFRENLVGQIEKKWNYGKVQSFFTLKQFLEILKIVFNFIFLGNA